MTRYDETDILARTLYGEARGEGLAGIEAVASVVLNRLSISLEKGDFWWGNRIAEICLKPFQFSCWNPDDVNFEALQRADSRDPVFALCERVAARAVKGGVIDTTAGATHYHTLSVAPAWARKWIPCAQIGNHLFYREMI